MSVGLKRTAGSFLKGFLVALLLVALVTLSGLAEPRQAGAADGPTRDTTQPLVGHAGISCAWEAVSTYCSSSYCYANKRTADRVCVGKGYQFASSYTYDDLAQSSANRWTGTWTSTSGDMSDDVAPKGGGGLSSTGGNTTSTISYVHCC